MKKVTVILATFLLSSVILTSCGGDSEKKGVSKKIPDKEENKKSTNNELDDDLMMKIIEKKINTPMDSAMTIKCFEYLKTSYGLMIKLLEDVEAQNEAKKRTDMDLNTLIMSNYLICTNAIDLLDKSIISMNSNMQTELVEYKKKLEIVGEKVMN
jgi:hypothetical protein